MPENRVCLRITNFRWVRRSWAGKHVLQLVLKPSNVITQGQPNPTHEKKTAKTWVSHLGPKPRGRKKAVPGVGESLIAVQKKKDDQTIPLASSAPVQQLERVRSGRSRGRVPTGGGIHARVTDIEFRILVSECYTMREYDICSVNAGVDYHQPPDPFAGRRTRRT